jgi:hypothetical protein
LPGRVTLSVGRFTAERSVPIRRFVRDETFDSDTIALISRTFERVCAELGLKLIDPAAEVVAYKIIELVQSGVMKPATLYLATMEAFKLVRRE